MPDESFHFPPEWCRATLAHIGDAVIASDAAGRVTFLNPVAESLTGWTREEAVGVPLENVFTIVEQTTRRAVESPAVRALREGVIVGLGDQTLLIAKDGTERSIGPVDHSAAPIRNEQGELAGVLLVFRDITELSRRERETRHALAYAENIIATLREPFLVLDKDLRVKTANRTFYDRFQVEKQETEGRFIFDLGNGQWNIPGLRKMLDEVLSGHPTVHDFPVEHDFPSIGKRMMRLNARRCEPEASRPASILLAFEDVTDHHRAERIVRSSELRYRRLFETAKDGILILDAVSGEILDANPFMTELLSYSRAELLGKELWMIGLFNEKSENEAAFRHLQQHGYIRYDHLPLKGKGGKQTEVEFVSNVYYADRRLVAQCNIRDNSERNRLEAQTKEQAATLADLHRRKDEFLAMLSHELRNPLAPILNAVELLRLEPGESQLKQQALAIIERQLGQLVHLVNDLLEVSRISTGRIHLDREQLDLRLVAERAVETARPLIDHRRQVLAMDMPTLPVWIEGDATRLEQVIINLLNNAAKFTDVGGQIQMRLWQDGNEARLEVRDSGVGIAPELLPRIFDLFTQAERSLARSQGGLGIGLSLVQRLVEAHAGKVTVHSTLGKGSEFVVHLPLATTIEPQPKAAIVHVRPSVRTLRLLVVDDNVDTAKSLAALLAARGHDVQVAYDGCTALEVTREHRPDVVLLDIGLPGFDGLEIAKRLREQPASREVVLIAITGYGQTADHLRSREAGFDHHLVKPTDFGKLLDILANVMQEPDQAGDDNSAQAEETSSGSTLRALPPRR